MRTMSTALAALFLAACSSGDSTSPMAGGKACCQARLFFVLAPTT